MIERVARALCKARLRDPDEELTILTGPKGGSSQPRWMFHVSEARAAIEAMREPTSPMVEIGGIRPHEWEKVETVQDTYDLARRKWREQIDAALADG